MWSILISCLIVFILGLLLISKNTNFFEVFIACLLSVFFLLPVNTFITIPMTTGLTEGYSHGTQTGFITSIKQEGLIWKTWEGRMQEGVGEQTNVGDSLKFSIVDKNVVDKLKEFEGSRKKVILIFDQWLITPYRLGCTSSIVTDVKELN